MITIYISPLLILCIYFTFSIWVAYKQAQVDDCEGYVAGAFLFAPIWFIVAIIKFVIIGKWKSDDNL